MGFSPSNTQKRKEEDEYIGHKNISLSSCIHHDYITYDCEKNKAILNDKEIYKWFYKSQNLNLKGEIYD